MKKILFGFSLVFLSVQSLFAWGPTGHRVTGEIATQYLSPETQLIIDDILDGDSLALISTFGDDIKSDAQYRKYSPLHYINIPFGETYEESKKNPQGDVITGIAKAIEVLKDEKSTKEDKAFWLKMLVHFVGDMHQPLHVGIGDDKGGNDFQVRWFNQGTNLHRVWDSQIINSFGMSYTELANNAKRLTAKEIQEMQAGTYLDWMNDSRELMKDIYENTEIGEKLGYEYMYKYTDTVRLQLQKGGLRLAALLNEIFKAAN